MAGMPGRRLLAAVIVLLSCSVSLFAQDTPYDLLVKRDGSILEVRIVEDKPDEILYRKKEDPGGAVYAISKSELLSARYSNGETVSFTITISDFYSDKPASGAAPPVSGTQYLYNAAPPKNEFQKSVLNLPSERLQSEYLLYRKASKSGLSTGFWAIGLQVGVNLIGTLIIAANTETDPYGVTISKNDNAVRTGTLLLLGGTFSGIALGPMGFIRAAKNGNKARYIRSEMRRRNIPLNSGR